MIILDPFWGGNNPCHVLANASNKLRCFILNFDLNGDWTILDDPCTVLVPVIHKFSMVLIYLGQTGELTYLAVT